MARARGKPGLLPHVHIQLRRDEQMSLKGYRSGSAMYRALKPIADILKSMPEGMDEGSVQILNREHAPSAEEVAIMNEEEGTNPMNETVRVDLMSFKDLEDESFSQVDSTYVSGPVIPMLKEAGADISAFDAWKLMGHVKVTKGNIGTLMTKIAEQADTPEKVDDELEILHLTPAIVEGIERTVEEAAWSLCREAHFFNSMVNGTYGNAPPKLTCELLALVVQQCMAPEEWFTNQSAAGGRIDLRGSATGTERKVLSDRQFEILFGVTDVGEAGFERDPVRDRILASLAIVNAFAKRFPVQATREELCVRANEAGLRNWHSRQTGEDNQRLRNQIAANEAAKLIELPF